MRILLSTLLVGVALTLGGCFEGPKGDKGDAGIAGPAGPAGKDGAPGKDGAAGKDGAPGKDGAAGKDGVAGRDGATIRTVRHSCSGGNCSHSCDKGEVVVTALCIGGAAAAQFKIDGSDLVATCGGTENVTMQLYCMKP
jgi:hypothetical protein